MKLLILLSLCLSLFGSCAHRSPSNGVEEKSLYDSLETRCYDRVTLTDSLRLEAQNFMRQTQTGTPEYFRARQFYINSYFNEKKFDRVLEMLDEAEQMPGYRDLPGTQADYLYTRSRCYQFTQQYDKAIAVSRRIMDLVPAPGDTLAHKTIRTRAVGAMNNVNNIFYFTNRPAEGAEWFRQLRATPPGLLRECCMRDMMIFEGYLRGLSGQSQLAEAIMDSARSLPIYQKTPENTFRDCSFTASVFYNLPHRQKDMEQLLKYAISEGRKDKNMHGINWAMSLLGKIYFTQFRYKESIQLQYQGLEIGLQQKDSAFCAHCYHNLSVVYLDWNLLPQARYYNDKAFAWDNNRHVNASERGHYYYNKFLIKQKEPQSKREERLRLLASADSCFTASSEMKNKYIPLHKASEWLLTPPFDVAKGMKAIDDFVRESDPSLHYMADALRTIGLIRARSEVEARKVLLNIKDGKGQKLQYMDTLFNHYLTLNDTQAIGHIAQLREPLSKEYYEQKTREAVVSADIRYQTQEKEKENQLLTAEVELKNSRLQTLVFTALFLLATGLSIGGWLWMRLRLQEREKQLSQQQLREQSERLQLLIASRQELNNHNEELLRQLVDIQSVHDKTCDLDRVMESLQPRLLTNEEEKQFRIAFASLYPTVLHRLRSICPHSTRTDELLCMLIVLKQTNEEISRTLGITRSSVLKNRYRLRAKLDLPEDSNFDIEVRALLLPE